MLSSKPSKKSYSNKNASYDRPARPDRRWVEDKKSKSPKYQDSTLPKHQDTKTLNPHQPKFKQSFVDFIVEEKLPFVLAKEGPRCYIQIEKRNLNTMDLVKQIMQMTKLPRKKIGIAWLKDKHALARQWICIHTNDIIKIGDQKFMKDFQAITKVISYGFHSQALNLSTPIRNQFSIRLKYENALPLGKKEEIEKRLATLAKTWFRNYFGEQRFGYTKANHRIAQAIIEWEKKHMADTEKKFKLQSLSSRFFNQYLDFRWKKIGNLDPLEWEDGVATWPMFGDDLKSPPAWSVAAKLEDEWKEHFEINNELLAIYKQKWIFWLRRPLRVIPQWMKHSRQGNHLLISFSLPKSAYASVLVEELTKD